jgi:hypothetical protein
MCVKEDETTIHILRECRHATQIWIRLVVSNHIINFFSLTCRDLIFDKMAGSNNKEWQTIFIVVAGTYGRGETRASLTMIFDVPKTQLI